MQEPGPQRVSVLKQSKENKVGVRIRDSEWSALRCAGTQPVYQPVSVLPDGVDLLLEQVGCVEGGECYCLSHTREMVGQSDDAQRIDNVWVCSKVTDPCSGERERF